MLFTTNNTDILNACREQSASNCIPNDLIAGRLEKFVEFNAFVYDSRFVALKAVSY